MSMLGEDADSRCLVERHGENAGQKCWGLVLFETAKRSFYQAVTPVEGWGIVPFQAVGMTCAVHFWEQRELAPSSLRANS